MIKALIVDQADDDSVSASIHEIEASQLPDDGEVDIAVEYSTINYKDALAATGAGRILRTFPMHYVLKLGMTSHLPYTF